jgi:ferredoxin, 2Fe-2S
MIIYRAGITQEMPTLEVTDTAGKRHSIAAQAGLSVMENIRDAGIDELLALCGGCLSCATCHVHVEEPWIERVGSAEGNEADLLETSDHVRSNSRLCCQIEMSERLDGLAVTIAPENG